MSNAKIRYRRRRRYQHRRREKSPVPYYDAFLEGWKEVGQVLADALDQQIVRNNCDPDIAAKRAAQKAREEAARDILRESFSWVRP